MVQVKREGNLVSNELAHLARQSDHSTVFLGDAPACVLHLITNDYNPQFS